MKKGKLILGVTIIITIVFCGCSENNGQDNNDLNDELDRFVGTWKGTHGINLLDNETWIFYSNRTLNIVDEFGIDLGTYTLDGNELEIKIPDPEEPEYVYTMWYDYSFSDNDNKLHLENTIGLIGDFTKKN